MWNRRIKRNRYLKAWDVVLLLAVIMVFAMIGLCRDRNNNRELEVVMEQQGIREETERGKIACYKMEQKEAIRYRYIKGCPLSGKVQREIFEICADANFSFEFIMALAEKESDFDPKCVSDDGQSIGLLQIQEKWHGDIMDKLGCDDLYDPVQNVRVGVELLKRHFVKYQDAADALMAYNGGQAYADLQIRKGKISDYASDILERAVKFEKENGL